MIEIKRAVIERRNGCYTHMAIRCAAQVHMYILFSLEFNEWMACASHHNRSQNDEAKNVLYTVDTDHWSCIHSFHSSPFYLSLTSFIPLQFQTINRSIDYNIFNSIQSTARACVCVWLIRRMHFLSCSIPIPIQTFDLWSMQIYLMWEFRNANLMSAVIDVGCSRNPSIDKTIIN